MLAELVAAYGPDWPDRFLLNLRFDPDCPRIELAPPVDEDLIVVRKVFLRLPLWADEKFKQLGKRHDCTPSEMVSIWIAERIADQ